MSQQQLSWESQESNYGILYTSTTISCSFWLFNNSGTTVQTLTGILLDYQSPWQFMFHTADSAHSFLQLLSVNQQMVIKCLP